MNDSESQLKKRQHTDIPPPGWRLACLSLGSNIQPEVYLPRAIDLLRQAARVDRISTCWETAAFGGGGPNFINLAISLWTELEVNAFKSGPITAIENRLGRVRSADKNAPRTIDLDIILLDSQVLDPALWTRAYLAITVSELFPDLQDPTSGRTLRAVAQDLAAVQPAVMRQAFLSTPR